MRKFKKPLKMLTVSAEIFDKIIINWPNTTHRVDSIQPYQYGYSKKIEIYYTDTYLVCNEDTLVIMGLLEDNKTRFDRGHWYQYLIKKVNSQEEPITKETSMSPAVACRVVKGELKKHYTEDEIIDIYDSHRKESSQILHLVNDAELGKIKKLDNCVYYDLNGAYASELIKMFPKCEEQFSYWFNHRHDDNNKYKNLFNYFVGCLTENPEKRAYKINNNMSVRDIYPQTRHYIVDNITKKMLKALDFVDGYNIYINTDGFIVQDPQRNIQHSKVAGEFKIEYQGPVYSYRDINYTIFQYGDEIKGNLPIELRDKVDLRSGKVVHYTRYLEDGRFCYKDIKEEIIDIKENN